MRNEVKCKMFESKLTNGQLILINRMIADGRLQSTKEAIISEVTDGRSENVRELFVNEATDVIRYLKSKKIALIAD